MILSWVTYADLSTQRRNYKGYNAVFRALTLVISYTKLEEKEEKLNFNEGLVYENIYLNFLMTQFCDLAGTADCLYVARKDFEI